MKFKDTYVQAHIHSLGGTIKTVKIIETRITDYGTEYVVDYNGIICTAIYNPFTCSYYADDIYGIIKENK